MLNVAHSAGAAGHLADNSDKTGSKRCGEVGGGKLANTPLATIHYETCLKSQTVPPGAVGSLGDSFQIEVGYILQKIHIDC